MSKVILTPQELVERWKGSVCTGTLANWRCQDKGPRYIKLGSRVGYPLEKVVEYEKSRLKKVK